MIRAFPILSAALGAAVFVALPAQAADGTAVYNANCAMCHVPGLANAPKTGDKAAWEPRLKAGRDALLASAIKGKGAMPPKAGNPKLSDEDLGAALDHMLAAVK
ncbi:c-type cytochrome [Leptothrix discophora]|uniref:C-type cytochrome n=1 Tax=Leptothrix discophora TaxID=89 RepID=A0ABT9G6Y9_LEPDI|nr:c-type cytochrome [Leptothrix discophora]MDP4302027.1 c-type cytochrome [Leptothrix discophora]